MKAIQNQGEIKTIKRHVYSDKDSPLISWQKEIFSKLSDQRLEEITNLDKKVNPDGFTADANLINLIMLLVFQIK